MPDRHALIVTSARVEFDGGAAMEADEPFPHLDFVDDRARQLKKRLEHDSLGFAVEHLAEPDAEQLGGIEQRLRKEVELVHCFGHGYVRDNELHLVPAAGDFDRRTNFAALSKELNARQHSEYLLVLDLCQAGAGLESRSIGDIGNVWVACAAGGQNAYNGWFTEALATVLEDLAEERIDIDPAAQFMSMDRFRHEFSRRYLRTVNDSHNRKSQSPEPHFLGKFTNQALAMSPEVPFFANPRFDPDALELQVARAEVESGLHPFLDLPYFLDRASPRFTGRGSVMRDLGRWRTGGEPNVGLKIVCGAAGSGKSAIVGAFVLTGHRSILDSETFKEPSRRLRAVIDTACGRPADGPFAAVHARRLSFDAAFESIIDQLEGKGNPALEQGSVDSVADLASWLERQAVPPLLVLDALDEAADPQSLVHVLLLPLLSARRDGGPAARILVAGRADTERNRELLALLEHAAAGPSRIDLNRQDRTELLDDLTSFLIKALESQGGCCHDRVDDLASAVALDLVDHGDPEVYGRFLVASLYAKLLGRRTHRGDDPDQHLPHPADVRVPRTLPEVLKLDFGQITDPIERRSRRGLLAALAFSQGDGMPADIAGMLATEVFSADSGLNPVAMLHDPAGIKVYLRSFSGPDGVPIYRLFHQSLDDYLRANPIGEDGLA